MNENTQKPLVRKVASKSKNSELEKACAEFPTLNDFAIFIGAKSYKTVQQWHKNEVPIRWCFIIEEKLDRRVICERLNPDPKINWKFQREGIHHPSVLQFYAAQRKGT